MEQKATDAALYCAVIPMKEPSGDRDDGIVMNEVYLTIDDAAKRAKV